MRISDWSSDVCSSDLLDLWGLTGVAEWSVSPDVSVKSITGYRRTESHFMRDDDTPFRLLELQTDQTARQFSQELQFSGRTMDSRLTWLIGLYYFSEKEIGRASCRERVCQYV